MSGGGGSSSSKGGGLKEGLRRRCIGLLWPEFGSCTCAAAGLAKVAGDGRVMVSTLDDDAL